jgi:hypothetical protein
MKDDSPYFFAETLWNSTALSARSVLLAISTRYSFPSFLNTSETTELSLDFSTGVVVEWGETQRIAISPDGKLCVLSEKVLLLLKIETVGLACFFRRRFRRGLSA